MISMTGQQGASEIASSNEDNDMLSGKIPKHERVKSNSREISVRAVMYYKETGATNAI